MADEMKEFWRRLLEHGNDETERRRNWNTFCRWRFEDNLGCSDLDLRDNGMWRRLGVPEDVEEQEQLVSGIREQFDDHILLPKNKPDGWVWLQPRMDFSQEEFPDDFSFAGRVLIRADFSNAFFSGLVDFSGAVFAGEASFTESTFHDEVLFDGARFPQRVSFDRATFNGHVSCRTAEVGQPSGPGGAATFGRSRFLTSCSFSGMVFNVGAAFDGAEFRNTCVFSNAVFNASAVFGDVEFQGRAIFEGTRFRAHSNFNNAKFRNTTSFLGGSFGMPPKFFETEIHEDVDFSEVDWSDAEESYKLRLLSKGEAEVTKPERGEAVRAWDRLALMMSRQDNPAERHEFFRLKMRAQRWRDGCWRLSSIANWVFDKLSDYGWGMRPACCWWAGHILVGMIILALAVLTCPSCPELGVFRIAWYGFLVSLSNSLAFLRLGAEGGHLHGPYEALEDATRHADWVFSTVGTVQAILGPILLFLVLLTLRNRFRLG